MLARRGRLLAVVLAASALAGCDGGDDKRAGSSTPTTPRTNAADACTGRVGALACELPLRRKLAQLLLVGAQGTGLVRELGLAGVVLEPGGAGLRRRALGTVAVEPGPAAGRTGGAEPGRQRQGRARRGALHPWVLAVQEGGDQNAIAGVAPVTAAADVGSAGEAAAGARESARALRRVGVTGVLGPVVDVGVEAGGALGARVYSDDAEEVAQYARRTVLAYRRGGVLSAVRHFPGIGAANGSTAEGPASVGLTAPELRERDLLPFVAAIKAGAPAIVVGHALYPISGFTVPASLSRVIVTGLLRDELGFEGVAITDDLADPAVSLTTSAPLAAVEAVEAGADLVYISGPASAQRAAYGALLRAVRDGRLSRQRIDQALRRVLAAKDAYGLLR